MNVELDAHERALLRASLERRCWTLARSRHHYVPPESTSEETKELAAIKSLYSKLLTDKELGA